MRRNLSIMLATVLLLSLIVPMNALAADAGIKITGDVATETTVTLAELKAMETLTATYGSLNSSNSYSETEFTGVELAGVLELAGLKDGATTITFISSDGYKSSKSVDILSAEYLNDLKVILAWDDDGNIQVVIPQTSKEDYNKSGWARELVEIAISGAPAEGDGDSDAPAGIFTDVPANHPAADYIGDIFERGITTGLTATTFGPDANLTRAQFVTFLGRLADIDAASYADDTSFDDITGAGADYAIGYINWAAELGITTGTASGKFSPNDKVTRQQVATFIYRYALAIEADISGEDVEIKDAGDVNDWAADGVAGAVSFGLMNLTDGKFRPNDYCTRAEMAQVISLFPVDETE